MTTKPPSTDENQSAAGTIGKVIARHSEPLPADLEAAWTAWSAGIAKVDARTMTLLRAAFEAGAEASSLRK
jgi:hypothetical protein